MCDETEKLTEAMQNTVREIVSVLNGRVHSIWLYGSLVLDDFRPGWSDIDLIAFAEDPITETQAMRLVPLRQSLLETFSDNPFYACFEGAILPLDAYRTHTPATTVYWGTSGQRTVERYALDPFSRYELSKWGRSLYGNDDRGIFTCPSRDELVAAVRRHYEAIRTCAVQTDESLYACGWLLDIARGIYTLKNGGVIGKTQAGEWALAERLFSDEASLKRTLEIRRNPLAYKEDAETREWLRQLGPTVQRCADVLEAELNERE